MSNYKKIKNIQLEKLELLNNQPKNLRSIYYLVKKAKETYGSLEQSELKQIVPKLDIINLNYSRNIITKTSKIMSPVKFKLLKRDNITKTKI